MSRRGFTLSEVLTALALAGLVFMLSARYISVSAGLTWDLDDRRRTLDVDMNAERWLGTALGNVSVGTEGAVPFEGTDSTLYVTCWFLDGDGWSARHAMQVHLRDGVVRAELSDGPVVELWREVAALDLEYLLVPGEQSRWVPVWVSPVSPPVAMRLHLIWVDSLRAAETLLFSVRGSG